MKVIVDQVLKDFDGNNMTEEVMVGGKKATKVVTLGYVVESALMTIDPQKNVNMPPADKVMRYDLAMRVHRSPVSVDVTIEELALIKEAVGVFTPAVVGQAYKMLESGGN